MGWGEHTRPWAARPPITEPTKNNNLLFCWPALPFLALTENAAMTPYLTGNEAAALLGISRKTLYRWMAEGRLSPTEWTVERLTARSDLVKRPRGPKRNPHSIRYVTG